jgi:hypothetical protein
VETRRPWLWWLLTILGLPIAVQAYFVGGLAALSFILVIGSWYPPDWMVVAVGFVLPLAGFYLLGRLLAYKRAPRRLWLVPLVWGAIAFVGLVGGFIREVGLSDIAAQLWLAATLSWPYLAAALGFWLALVIAPDAAALEPRVVSTESGPW